MKRYLKNISTIDLIILTSLCSLLIAVWVVITIEHVERPIREIDRAVEAYKKEA